MKVRIVTTANFCEVFFFQYIFVLFCFVLCIHLVPSCNSLLMFVSILSVYLIIIPIYLYTLDFITHLFIYL